MHDGCSDFIIAHFTAGNVVNGTADVQDFIPSFTKMIGACVCVGRHEFQTVLSNGAGLLEPTGTNDQAEQDHEGQGYADCWRQRGEQTVVSRR